MKAVMIATTVTLLTAAPLLAQTGGFAATTDTTSGNAVAEAGVRVAPHLLVFGDVGRQAHHRRLP
jgi:hypothetical protein